MCVCVCARARACVCVYLCVRARACERVDVSVCLLHVFLCREVFATKRAETHKKLTILFILQAERARPQGEEIPACCRGLLLHSTQLYSDGKIWHQGSKRVYKFVRAATKTLSRPLRRRNHPGETWDGGAGHR